MSTLIVTVAAVAGLLVAQVPAQHEEHHQDKAQRPSEPDTKSSGMMSGEMMPRMMPQMMMGQTDTAKLTDVLLKSFAAIEAEKDPAALKAKLAEHGALLKQLQAKVESQSHMMEMMQHMMSGSMMTNEKMGKAAAGTKR